VLKAAVTIPYITAYEFTRIKPWWGWETVLLLWC